MKKKVLAINVLFFILIVLILTLSNSGSKKGVDESSDSSKLVLVSDVKVKPESYGYSVVAEIKNRTSEDLNNIKFKISLENSVSHAAYTLYVNNHLTLKAKEKYIISYEFTTSGTYDVCASFQASIGSSTNQYFDVLNESELDKGLGVGKLIRYIIPIWFGIDILVAMYYILVSQKQRKMVSASTSSYHTSTTDSTKSLKKVKCPFCGNKYYPVNGEGTCPSCGAHDVY